MTLFDLFMDIYGHRPPVIDMLRHIMEMTDYTQHALHTQMTLEHNHMKQLWYRAALYCRVTSDKMQSLRARCKAEILMRVAWQDFMRARLVEMPEVPPVPG